MKLAVVYSRAIAGLASPLITVEVHITGGLPAFNIVGLPETAVKESKDRVRSAIINNGFDYPCRRITVNLAPAELPKESTRFDLPIAIGILVASQQLVITDIDNYEFVGELALSGEIRPIRGVLPIALAAKNANHKLIIPVDNHDEASLVKHPFIYTAKHLLEVCAFLQGQTNLPMCVWNNKTIANTCFSDYAEVKGQMHAKRALEIAAAGRHSILFIGPPGTGKTMLASRFPTILPDITEQQSLEVAALHSLSSQGFNVETWGKIPYRSPHHTSSSAAIAGGGRPPKPGEISLANHGVLFLDELPEFERRALEAMREPLESRQITLSRATSQITYPADFQLLAAMNPCPCGFSGSSIQACFCSDEQVRRYTAKISGPLLSRIDLQVIVSHLKTDLLLQKVSHSETSFEIKQRVVAAMEIQMKRQSKLNALLTASELDAICKLSKESENFLKSVIEKLRLSPRVYHRILKIARTIADLDNQIDLKVTHLAEAITYRHLDKLNTKIG